MEVTFKYEDLIARCEQLSSFEADGKVDANGESRYLEIHINEVDKQLIRQYIMQARYIMEERFGRAITTEDNNGGFKWNVDSNTRWKQNASFERHVTEAIASYAMSAWLSDKLPERVTFYENIFNGSMAMASKNIFTKSEPV